MKFLRIKEWETYQHYKDRNPPWIKLHRQVLQRRSYMRLDDDSKLLMFVCMLLAADTGNKIPLDREYIQHAGCLRKRPDVRPLIENGFCELIEEQTTETKDCSELQEDASSDASTAQADACTKKRREEERREETEKRQIARPTLAEITAYCQERQNRVDPQKWLDYYSANGFRVGRNPMKDWRAAVRTWERNGFGGPFSEGKPNKAEQRQIENLAVNERVKQRIRERVGVLEQ